MTNPSSPAKTNAGGSNGKRRRDSSSSASSTADLSEKKDEIHDQNGFMDLSSSEEYGDMLLEYMKHLHQKQRKVVEDFEKRQKVGYCEIYGFELLFKVKLRMQYKLT